MTATRPNPYIRVRRRRLAVAIAVLLLVICLVVSLVVRAVYSGKVLPGVHVAGLALGGTSESDLRARLAPVVSRAKPVTIVAGGLRVTLRPENAGYSPNLEQTAARAMRAGRDGALGGLPATLTGLAGSHDVAVAFNADARLFATAVDGAADRIDRAAEAGALVIDPASLAVTTNPPRSGREVDRTALATRLRAALERHAGGIVQAPLRTTAVASPAQVASVALDARAVLRAPLRLIQPGSRARDVAPTELAPVLRLVSRDGARNVRLGADAAQLAALVTKIATERDRPARNASVDAPARVATLDAKGDASWRPRPADVTVRPGSDGRVVGRAALAAEIRAAIGAGRHRARLPMQAVKPAVSAAQAGRIDALIGTFTTHYVPGQPRVTNIRLIAKAIDGTVVPAGGHFSLNAASGERTEEKGYVEAPFISEGRIVPSIGGGVSQFSTTLYNAVYFAGLQLDGHRPHSFYIDRYPVGREATLNFGDIDMTWTNDTDAPVLIRASTDDSSVAVSLYGENGGRRVSAEAADRVPSTDGHDFSITVTRVVRYHDGRVVRQPFTTRYDKPPPEE